jgi:predicted metal-dependent hydrolase
VSRPRYTDDALPAYSFVPGRFPHPHTDPAGHRFGSALPPAQPLEQGDWESSHRYLLAIDLFNHGYYWEAHEAWEALWNAHERRGPAADLLKCLIQLAVVGVKLRQGMRDAAIAHARRAAELARAVRGATDSVRFLGLDVAKLEQRAEQLAAEPPQTASETAAVELVFAFQLTPKAK